MKPVAIVGIGCKLPGGVERPADFWARLLAADDLVTETPPDRWSVGAHFHPRRDVPGRTYSRWGGYVADAAGFDAAFFGLTPREAARMDPQQRWALETVWEAIEDAGLPLAALSGTGAGVYVGVSSCDYGDIQKRSRYDVDAHNSTGSALSIVANRISYLFDLRGPSLSVDTACSSSLVALDLACRALDRGDVPLALAGGVNAILQADVAVAFSKAGMLSPTGRCRPFAAAADGFVRSEGAAVVVLKPLVAALADGDRVYAVIRSTLANQDGRTGGLTVPSTARQQSLLEEAYRRAGVRPDEVGYVEAHGTGTPVGDPIEAAAIGAALGVHRPSGRPLWVGSVKSNLGHLEPASGVVGLVKLALALHHRTIPPNAHFEAPNPRIPFDRYQLQVPTTPLPWEPHGCELLWGGVNSFGFGGTNAHAVLSSVPEAPDASAADAVAERLGPAIWTTSARSATALRELAEADAAFLERALGERFHSLAVAARRRRSHHAHRLAVVADTAVEAAKKLRGGAGGNDVFAGQIGQDAPAVALVFTGQGTQWPGMARDLLDSDPRFADAIAALDAALRPEWGRSLVDELRKGNEGVYRSDVGQPLMFAIQVALARILSDWEVRPVAVLGHSIGEVAAAHAAGALSLADACRVIVHRSRVQEWTRGTGAMAAVGLSEEEAHSLLANNNGLHVAAFNSPSDLTLSGDEDAVHAAVGAVAAEGKFSRLLPFPYAFHSPKMDPCRDEFLRSAAGIASRRGDVPFVSTVVGAELCDAALDADYWWRNIREPVRFAAAVSRAAELGATVFVEVGPHPGLLRYVYQTLGAGAAVVPTLRRGEDGSRCLAAVAADLYVRGVPIDWRAHTTGRVAHVALPQHPWKREVHWAEGEESKSRRLAAPTHPLLGVREPGPGRRWQSCLSTAEFPYLADHGFRTRNVFPAAAHIEVMLAAAGGGSFAVPVGLDDVSFDKALWADNPVLLRTTHDAASRRMTVAARPLDDADVAWEVFSRGIVRVVEPGELLRRPDDAHLPPADASAETAAELYARFDRAGHRYGPLFRSIRRLWARERDVWADVALDPALNAEAADYYIHPALLDGAFQSVLRATPIDEERESMFLPVRLDRVEWRRRPGTEVVCRVRNVHVQDVRWFADIDLFTPEGELVAALAGCCCVKKPQEPHIARGEANLYLETWEPAPSGERSTAAPAGPWLVVDPNDAAGGFVRRISETVAGVAHDRGHEDRFSEFLASASTLSGTVVVWAAGGAVGKPSVANAIESLKPLLETARSLTGWSSPMQLWLVTAGATWGYAPQHEAPDLLQAAVGGLLRTVSTELPGVTCRLLDLDPSDLERHAECAALEMLSGSREEEIAYRGGRRFAARLGLVEPDALGWRSGPRRGVGSAFRLATTEPGSLDGLAWVEADYGPPAPNEVEIEVRAAGLNFRDVLKALDIYPLAPAEPRSFGDEVSGVVRRVGSAVSYFRPGDAVVAVTVDGFGDLVRAPDVLVADKPPNLSFEEAAAVPIAYLTADYALNETARVRAGETVLVHAAAGGVGQAAVQIARRAGAVVLGTASSEKHDFLRERGVRHVFNSRNLSFADGVRDATDGQGVDVVLNSLAGEFIPRSLELLRPLGRFVEIGKKDIFANSPLDLHPFRGAVSFHALDLAAVIRLRPQGIGQRLRLLLEAFARGELEAPEVTTFPAARIGDAFRFMAQGKHRGKVVVNFGTGELPARVLSHERPLVRPDGSYLVTGGLSGFGLKTAEWLAEQGAKSLVLAGRSGAATEQSRQAVARLESRGIRVEVAPCDVSDPTAVDRLVSRPGRPPLRGVIHAAMVLLDEPLARVQDGSLEKVLAPKIMGAWNLHRATRDLSLDWFVAYSSVASVLGSAGQASYVAANRFLDALAYVRQAEGLPALTVNWGPLAGAGVVASNPTLARYLESVGLGLVTPDESLRFLKFLLRRDAPTAGVARIDPTAFKAANPKAGDSYRLAPIFAGGAASAAAADGSDLAADVLARPEAERTTAVVGHLRTALAGVLRGDASSLDAAAPLTSYGVDSLMAFEFKLKVDKAFQVNVPADRLSAGTSLTDLAAVVLSQLTAHASAPQPSDGKAAPSLLNNSTAARNTASPSGPHLRVVTGSEAKTLLDGLTFDAAALLYVPDRVQSVGGVADAELGDLFGHEPFVSHLYESSLGRIGVVTLPLRGKDLFVSKRVPELVRRAADLVSRHGARCLSLTGLIPAATDYGHRVRDWIRGFDSLQPTTGHATTTAAVVLNLRCMLARAGRSLAEERIAVLGLGSIGRSCLSLLLDVLPHPASITLCDVFTKQEEARAVASEVCGRHGYRGPVHVAFSARGLPDELFESTTILSAVSIPDVIPVDRLRPGTLVVDDSYPPAFVVEQAAARAEADGDILFGNAGMVRLPDQILETVFLPPGADAAVARFGSAAFREEIARDPNELTACILSSLLTDRHEGFRPTLGLAEPEDLLAHFDGLARLGITAARPQCGKYFMPAEIVEKFRARFGLTQGTD